MANYDIRPLQLKILETLKSVDEVCSRHGLRYAVIAGTMLGAVRHKGFIPWDDDLDIAMPRPDYDRLLAHHREWLPPHLELICNEDSTDYPFPFAKIQDSTTTLIERPHIRYLGGVYIDVFPIDGAGASAFGRAIHLMRYSFYKRIIYYLYRDPFKHGHGLSSWIPRLARKLFSRRGVHDRMRRLMTAVPYESADLVIDHDEGRRGTMPKSWLEPMAKIDFEGVKVKGFARPDDYLSQMYGDYMKVPDDAHKRQHNFHYMNLEEPYRVYREREERNKD